MTFADLLSAELRREPGRPLVTFYDETTGERIELSVTTYANWVAKAASLLVDEHGLERGDVLLVDLPTHWLGPVFLGAAWTAGLAVAFPSSAGRPSAVVCGPAGLDAWAERAEQLPVLACSLLPMGVRFAEPLPPGAHDVGVEVWGQPDAFMPYDPPTGADLALVDGQVTHDELFRIPTAAGSPGTATDGGRLLVTANPASPPGVAAVARPLATSGSLVLVTGASEARLDEIAEAERVTRRFG
ncbi:MAG TPA: TIGR03089 family protein [Nocardioides sp.]|uniref:TIGR03089 family protein n=1 Tax=Nocardioides sp. TaxID=35761 RepID=UPI002E35E218|nr:TIGR03089 family protein [Nocardioides sp.]HEX5088561.1 TIGR03089 family protein [Nocardioides sp.]